jgi:pyruvate dehydrogenase E1 component beta subunit
MAEMILRDAIARGLREALDSDENVFIMGEDIGAYQGAYAVTKGFLDEYGPERIRDTPISESAVVGAGVGAAMAGLRPIVEMMTINFMLLPLDQIVNHAAKIRYMSNGQISIPLVIRTVTGGGMRLGATHSQSLEGWFASVPGLKVVTPSDPYDALGLLRTAIADNDPVIYAEHGRLYAAISGEVPDDYYDIPLGQAAIKREGSDVTLIAYSRMVHTAMEAAELLAGKGVEAEVIDLRTLRPWDREAVVASVEKTGRAVVVEEAWRTGGFAGEVASTIQEEAFDYLDGPVGRVGGEDVPTPYAGSIESAAFPDAGRIVNAVEELFGT